MCLFCKDNWIQTSEIRKVAISVYRACFKWQRVGSYSSYNPCPRSCVVTLFSVCIWFPQNTTVCVWGLARHIKCKQLFAGHMVCILLLLLLCKCVAGLGKGPQSWTLQASKTQPRVLVYWQTWSLTTQALRTEAQWGATNTGSSWRSR